MSPFIYRSIRLGVAQAVVLRPFLIIIELYLDLPNFVSFHDSSIIILKVFSAISMVTCMSSLRFYNVITDSALAEGNDFNMKYILVCCIFLSQMFQFLVWNIIIDNCRSKDLLLGFLSSFDSFRDSQNQYQSGADILIAIYINTILCSAGMYIFISIFYFECIYIYIYINI